MLNSPCIMFDVFCIVLIPLAMCSIRVQCVRFSLHCAASCSMCSRFPLHHVQCARFPLHRIRFPCTVFDVFCIVLDQFPFAMCSICVQCARFRIPLHCAKFPLHHVQLSLHHVRCVQFPMHRVRFPLYRVQCVGSVQLLGLCSIP